MTYYIFFGLALAVAAAGVLARRRSPSLGQGMIAGGCIGLALCIAWQLRQNVFSPEPAPPDRGQAVVGYYLANQVLNMLGDRQGNLVLIFPPETVIDSDAVGTYAGTFERVLRGYSGLKVDVRTLDVPANLAKTGIPLSAFTQLASNAPAALAYVSFAGVPSDIGRLAPKAQPATPFFVYDPWGTTNWLGPMKQGLVRCAIVPRPGVPRESGEDVPGEPHEVFNRLYLLATPADADQVAAQLRGP